MARASGSGLMPICCPSCPTSRTSRARIRSLIRGSLLAGGVAIAKSCSSRRWFLLCAEWAVLPATRPENEGGGRRRMPTSARRDARNGFPRLVWVGVDPAHHVWPGGGEPHFPMQLCHVGYGHAATRHNLGRTGHEPLDARRRAPGRPTGSRGGPPAPRRPEGPRAEDLSPEEQAQLEAMQAQMEQVQAQLLAAPASLVVVNHAMGLYELAALHLMQPEPKLAEASLAIDALAALVEGLQGRLGEDEQTVREALAQLRAAYLEVRAARRGRQGAAAHPSSARCGSRRLPATHAGRPHLEGHRRADLDRAGAVERAPCSGTGTRVAVGLDRARPRGSSNA